MRDETIVFTDEALVVQVLEGRERTRRWFAACFFASCAVVIVGVAVAEALSGAC